MSEEMMEHRIHEWITANDLHGKSLRYGRFPLGMMQNFIERAEKGEGVIAALKQQLADVTRERDEARAEYHRVMDAPQAVANMNASENLRRAWVERDDARAQLAAAQASEAAMRKALDHIGNYSPFDPGYPMSYTKERAAELMQEMRRCAQSALAAPPSDAVKRIEAMEGLLAEAAALLGELVKAPAIADYELTKTARVFLAKHKERNDEKR